MRIDDPQVLAAIERLESTADTLRRLAGFPPRFPTPETTASRAPRWCPIDGCNFGFQSRGDLEHHLATQHADRAARSEPAT